MKAIANVSISLRLLFTIFSRIQNFLDWAEKMRDDHDNINRRMKIMSVMIPNIHI